MKSDIDVLISELVNDGMLVMDKDGYGRLNKRNIRFIEIIGLFQIGEVDETFDRWANSVEYEFDVRQAKGVRQLKRCLKQLNNLEGA